MLDYIYIITISSTDFRHPSLPWFVGAGVPEKRGGWFGSPGLKNKKQRENICPRSSTGRAGDL